MDISERWVVGTNAGTSLGSLDLALVVFEGPAERPRWRLVAQAEESFPPALEQRLGDLARGRGGPRELAEADALHGTFVGRSVAAALESWGVERERIAVVGSHGQTVFHSCGREPRCTLQLGSGAWIAEACGIPVANDFRAADLAAGGEGAPLSPLLDEVLFAEAETPQVVVNLGGISNASVVVPGAPALGFDGGPANLQLDAAARRLSGGRQGRDEDGALARAGVVDPAFEAALEQQWPDWIAGEGPRSTGREDFGEARLVPLLDRFRTLDPGALLATLTRFAARCFAARLRRRAPELFGGGPLPRVWLTGGGAHNRALVAEFGTALAPWPLASLDRWPGASAPGFVDAREAVLFALLADRRRAGVPSDTRRATGAHAPRVLGAWWPAP